MTVTVIPYSTLISYLHQIKIVAPILDAIVTTPMPKDDAEYHRFVEDLVRKTQSFAPLGILIAADDDGVRITVQDLARPVHKDITMIGYSNSSLKDIAQTAESCNTLEVDVEAIRIKLSALQEEKTATTQRTAALSDIEHLLHVCLMRIVKVLELAKYTCHILETLYKKA